MEIGNQGAAEGGDEIVPARISPERLREIQAVLIRWFSNLMGYDALNFRLCTHILFQHSLWQADEIERLMEVRDSLTDRLYSAKGASEMADRLERLREEGANAKAQLESMRIGLRDVIASLRDANKSLDGALDRANAEVSRPWTKTFRSREGNG